MNDKLQLPPEVEGATGGGVTHGIRHKWPLSGSHAPFVFIKKLKMAEDKDIAMENKGNYVMGPIK